MKPATKGIAALACGISVATATTFYVTSHHANGVSGEKPNSKLSKAKLVALDTLEHQLQRRFHDRNNIEFGYSRVVRQGARQHYTTVMDRPKDFSYYGDNGEVLKTRQNSNRFEIEIEPGKWVPYNDFKETMHSENADESRAIKVLRDGETVIYTAGMFHPTTSEPTRLKGPAYLKQGAPVAPEAKSVAGIAKAAWKSSNSVDETVQNGWVYRAVKVNIDDKSCIDCHAQMGQWSKDKLKLKYEMNKPIGMFIIGTKQ